MGNVEESLATVAFEKRNCHAKSCARLKLQSQNTPFPESILTLHVINILNFSHPNWWANKCHLFVLCSVTVRLSIFSYLLVSCISCTQTLLHYLELLLFSLLILKLSCMFYLWILSLSCILLILFPGFNFAVISFKASSFLCCVEDLPCHKIKNIAFHIFIYYSGSQQVVPGRPASAKCKFSGPSQTNWIKTLG